jgi:hypothetical protein
LRSVGFAVLPAQSLKHGAAQAPNFSFKRTAPRRLIQALVCMGSIDTLEILGVEASTRQLRLRSHRQQGDVVVTLDLDSLKSFIAALRPNNHETYWLRSVSKSQHPFLWWHSTVGYSAMVRAKRNGAREHVEVPCTKAVYRSLYAKLQAEWSRAV